MNPTRLFTAVTCVALAGFVWQTVHAQPLVTGQRTSGQTALGGPALSAFGSIDGSQKGMGLSRSGKCTDASGTTVPCPSAR